MPEPAGISSVRSMRRFEGGGGFRGQCRGPRSAKDHQAERPATAAAPGTPADRARRTGSDPRVKPRVCRSIGFTTDHDGECERRDGENASAEWTDTRRLEHRAVVRRKHAPMQSPLATLSAAVARGVCVSARPAHEVTKLETKRVCDALVAWPTVGRVLESLSLATAVSRPPLTFSSLLLRFLPTRPERMAEASISAAFPGPHAVRTKRRLADE